ncbi:zinc finger mym-type protein 2-like [Gigaspora margarita]|uniref:Zinc finger mym-type protein 2-like n=1 Tax=Gigaspora margarita TaxID=4874 RepID=A0A8H4B0P1_GIGMA|nr:zinc finger mym-type protein 2-like [Gigaspora margarita]
MESGFKPASEVDPVTQAINDLKKLSSNLDTIRKSSIKPNNKKFDEYVKDTQPDLNINQISDKRMLAILVSEFVVTSQLDRDTPIGLFRQIFLWIGCCAAKRGGSYLDIMASHFEERQDGGFNLLTIHDKTHKGGYYHRNTSGSGHNTPSQIIPPDELGVIGTCTDIKKYLSLRPANAEPNLFLQINKDSEG